MNTEHSADECIALVNLITQLNLREVSHSEEVISQYKQSINVEAEDVSGPVAIETHIMQLHDISSTILSLVESVHDICWVLQQNQHPSQMETLQVHSSYFTSVRTLLNGVTSTVNKWQVLLNAMNAKTLRDRENSAVKQLATQESVMRSQRLYLDRALNSVLLVKKKLMKLLHLSTGDATLASNVTSVSSSSLIIGALSTSSINESIFP